MSQLLHNCHALVTLRIGDEKQTSLAVIIARSILDNAGHLPGPPCRLTKSFCAKPEVSSLSNNLLHCVVLCVKEVDTASFFSLLIVAAKDTDLCLADWTD